MRIKRATALLVLVALAGCKAKPRPEAGPKPESELPADVARAGAPGVEHAIYPILKEHDWVAKDLAAHEPFLGTGKPPVPWIAYGYDSGDHYVFVLQTDLATRSLEDYKREAMANIEKFPAVWEPLMDHVLTASGKDFSSEMILSKRFLIEAQEKLGAKQILVGVPRRRVIYAADEDMPADQMKAFAAMFRYTFDDASYGNAPIANLLFRYRDGESAGAQIVEK
jgi:uncharacterized protein YtpQ (UPF0354 family)